MTNDIKAVLPSLLHAVEKPGRYTGGEPNSANKDPERVKTRFAFAFPDFYEIGMSYLGLQIIYHLLNAQPDVFCERVFAPAQDMAGLLTKNGLPLFTLETKTPVRDMDIVGFTLQYELSFSNVIYLLRLAGIPVLSADRGGDYPFIIAGGPCAFNPEPLADAMDLFLIGDGEEALPELCGVHARWKESGRPKSAFLAAAARVGGVYAPSFYTPVYDMSGRFAGMKKKNAEAPDRIRKRLVSNLDGSFAPEAPLVPLIEAVHDRAVTEIFRGCTRGCRFCQAGMIYRPVRERSLGTIESNMKKQLENTGCDEASILSLSTGDYSDVETLVSRLMKYCKDANVSLSLPSLRLDSFSFRVLEEIQKYKKSGLTFAPEAGSQRLRDAINKSITDQDIYSAAVRAAQLGWNHMKFYFMIGLPTESVEDLDGIVSVARQAVNVARGAQEKGRKTFTLTISVSNFVPKAHTPFQWSAQNTEREFLKKNLYLKEKLLPLKGVRFQFHDTRTSHVEGLLARGDRRALRAIVRAADLGCKFDSWREHFNYGLWTQAFRDSGISMDAGAFPADAKLPWDHIDPGVTKEYLLNELRLSAEGKLTRDCREGCTGCGLNCGKQRLS